MMQTRKVTISNTTEAAKVPELPIISSLQPLNSIPDPYKFLNESIVSSPTDWIARAAELSEMFQYYMYGKYRNGNDENLSSQVSP
jgi:hypothetical protein